jgi:hypothetical protein
VLPPNAFSSDEVARRQAEAARKNPNYRPSDFAQDTTARLPDGSKVYRSATQEELMAESVIPNSPPSNGGMPSMPNLVQQMAPAGVKPVPQAPTTPPPSFTPAPKPVPQPATPAPAAIASATAAMPAAPATPSTSGPAAIPVIGSSTPPTEMAMEAVLPANETVGKSVQTMLGAARKQMKSRDYTKAEEIVLQTQVMADTPELIKTAFEHDRTLQLLRTFWIAVHEGVKMLKEGEELTYDGKTAVVVKHDDVNLIVKQDGKDVVLVINRLVPGLAVKLAEKSLPAEQATTKLAIAAFLAMDQAADRTKAGTFVDEAVALGSGDVVGLRAVLEATP